eukprot:m.313737 g.313737  ORF g.313737 m.313737 type:complete len:543 (-) comp20259_c1_seq1:527-2155(-)
MFSFTPSSLVAHIIFVLSCGVSFGDEHGGTLPEVIEFSEWMKTFGIFLTEGTNEYHMRKDTFDSNIRLILEHNSDPSQSFRMGVNQFTAMNRSEFAKRMLMRDFSARDSFSADVGPEITSLPPPPPSMDWRTKGAVTPVKNQGSCGSCWAFSATGSLEGHYFLATGQLRSLSEQQLVDCAGALGNSGCEGGQMTLAFEYIKQNGGIDSEDDYTYDGADDVCWVNASKRVVATLDSYVKVAANEDALCAAVALGPVSVAIEADQAAFQHYKSGVLDAPCGTKLDHGVLVVGYTNEYWIVKNSWGATWGESGYIRMKRHVNKTGLCGIAESASYPVKTASKPVPVPPKTPGSKPPLPCNCTRQCKATCSAFGMACCGDGINCDCSPLSSCPQCGPKPPPNYSACAQGCAQCVSTAGVPGNICVPPCAKAFGSCPSVTLPGVTAVPHCLYCMTSALAHTGVWGSPVVLQSNATLASQEHTKNVPTVCGLICTATTTTAPFSADGCPKGATCKPLSMDHDTCENNATSLKEMPCAKTNTCGLCTYP